MCFHCDPGKRLLYQNGLRRAFLFMLWGKNHPPITSREEWIVTLPIFTILKASLLDKGLHTQMLLWYISPPLSSIWLQRKLWDWASPSFFLPMPFFAWKGQPVPQHGDPWGDVGSSDGHGDEERHWPQLPKADQQCKAPTSCQHVDLLAIIAFPPRRPSQSTATRDWTRPCSQSGFGRRW